MATDEEIEEGAKAMYGNGWDGPPDKQPGERMKSVWRRYAKLAIDAIDAKRGTLTPTAHGENR